MMTPDKPLKRRIIHIDMDAFFAAVEEQRKAAFACLKRIDLKKRVRLIGVRASNLENIA